MEEFYKLYQRNKILDAHFMNKYVDNDKRLHEKNCLELIVELGELANESRCFKYWSIKGVNRENLLEEYADCLLMVLYMFNYYNIDNIYEVKNDYSEDILFVFNDLIRMCAMFMDNDNLDEDYVMNVFNYLLHLGKLLNISENEIIKSCYDKIIKNEERLNSNY